MKNYEFISIKIKNNPVANGVLTEHREVIAAMANKGFRYVGCIPTKQGPSGKAVEMDLIFETEA